MSNFSFSYAYDMAGPRLLMDYSGIANDFSFFYYGSLFNSRMIDMSERIEKMERRQKVTRKEMSQKAVKCVDDE
ncbi:unnamed protein product, partial [Mesorhabditis belari]|uniref:Uncharacterized protein n=1 Tax=Mesorhabditis belari TaxID=2138241 RepID=A0AAF3FSN2_9BILA